jgi:hypothetical protein
VMGITGERVAAGYVRQGRRELAAVSSHG